MTELPSTFAAYKSQQERWARGLAQIAKPTRARRAWVHGRPLWHRWYLFSAVVRDTMWPAALVWMLALPMLIRAGHGWWLGTEDVAPRSAALFLYAAPPVLLAAADAVSAAALPRAAPAHEARPGRGRPPLLAPAVRHRADRDGGRARRRVCRGRGQRRALEVDTVVGRPRTAAAGFAAFGPSARARAAPGGAGGGSVEHALGRVPVVSVGGSTSEPTRDSLPGGQRGGAIRFEARSRDRGGGL